MLDVKRLACHITTGHQGPFAGALRVNTKFTADQSLAAVHQLGHRRGEYIVTELSTACRGYSSSVQLGVLDAVVTRALCVGAP